jgi:hypothetical protein
VSAPCAAPIDPGRLVDYWASDLDPAESQRVEEHLFACAACSAELERVARVVQALRTEIPAVVAASDMQALRARGLVVEENAFKPGTRREVTFRPGVDVLIHRLQGMDLGRAERVHVSVHVESTGEVILEDPFAPFDRERGEVLIACQRHFAGLPPDIAFVVRAHGTAEAGAEPVSLATFLVPHVFSP